MCTRQSVRFIKFLFCTDSQFSGVSLFLFHKVNIHIKGAKEKIKDKAMLMVLKTLLRLVRLKEKNANISTQAEKTHQHPHSVTQEAHVVVHDIFHDRQT